MSRALALLAFLLVGAGVGFLFYEPASSDDDVERPAAPDSSSRPPEAAPVLEATPPAVGSQPEAAGKPKTAYLLLPTGERMLGLNGVTESVELLWPKSLPYSPITGKRTDPEGTQWYVHADGSQSTTKMIFRSDVGRRVAMSIVANPTKVAPMKSADDEERDAKARR